MKATQPVLISLSTDGETWGLVAGLEAILILVLFLGWLSSSRKSDEPQDDDREVPK